jgi:hypothetical protein
MAVMAMVLWLSTSLPPPNLTCFALSPSLSLYIYGLSIDEYDLGTQIHPDIRVVAVDKLGMDLLPPFLPPSLSNYLLINWDMTQCLPPYNGLLG